MKAIKNALSVLLMSLALLALIASAAQSCEFAEGWMTGGGSIFATSNGNVIGYGGQVANDGRVTHGFVVHCTPRHSDNLEIVDHATGQNFHMQSLDFAACSDDLNIEPNPPDAGFDTFYGEGTGVCKQPNRPCWVRFTFKDGGERGGCLRDTAQIVVWDAAGDVIRISGDVDCGNNQAHGY